MNRAVRQAIACGCDPVVGRCSGDDQHRDAFRAGARDRQIAPGRRADMIVTSDLTALPVKQFMRGA